MVNCGKTVSGKTAVRKLKVREPLSQVRPRNPPPPVRRRTRSECLLSCSKHGWIYCNVTLCTRSPIGVVYLAINAWKKWSKNTHNLLCITQPKTHSTIIMVVETWPTLPLRLLIGWVLLKYANYTGVWHNRRQWCVEGRMPSVGLGRNNREIAFAANEQVV